MCGAFLFLDHLPTQPRLGFFMERKRVTDRRGSSAARGYGGRWQKARSTFLQQHPLCRNHESRGLVVAATVVDHIVPHRGDQKLFWDTSNWQALCKQCHDSDKQRLEKSGTVAGCDMSGIPIDPSHHWSSSGGGG